MPMPIPKSRSYCDPPGHAQGVDHCMRAIWAHGERLGLTQAQLAEICLRGLSEIQSILSNESPDVDHLIDAINEDPNRTLEDEWDIVTVMHALAEVSNWPMPEAFDLVMFERIDRMVETGAAVFAPASAAEMIAMLKQGHVGRYRTVQDYVDEGYDGPDDG